MKWREKQPNFLKDEEDGGKWGIGCVEHVWQIYLEIILHLYTHFFPEALHLKFFYNYQFCVKKE